MKYITEITNQIDEIENSSINILIHNNQIEAAKQCIKSFVSYIEGEDINDSRNNHVILLAKMQSGKTGVCNAIVNLMEANNQSLANAFKIQKYYFITGMNDVGLMEQTAKRVKDEITNSFEIIKGIDDIYGDKIVISEKQIPLKPSAKFFILKNSDLRNDNIILENCLIFIDESHFGTKEYNVLSKFLEFNNVNWRNDNNILKKKKIHIVSVSATPFSEIDSDTALVKNITYLKTEYNYYGVSEFFGRSLIYPVKDSDFKPLKKQNILFGTIENKNIVTYIKDAYNRIKDKNDYRGILIIRNKRNNKIIENDSFIKDNFKIIHFYGQELNGLDFKKLISDIKLMTAPSPHEEDKKPLLILIKGAFKAGITIPQSYKDLIFMVYDGAKDIHATSQGLLGRMCGYRTNDNNINNTYFYVNEENAQMYAKWENNNFSRELTPGNNSWTIMDSVINKDCSDITLSYDLEKCIEFEITTEEFLDYEKEYKKTDTSNKEFISKWLSQKRKIDIYENVDYTGECYLGNLKTNENGQTVISIKTLDGKWDTQIVDYLDYSPSFHNKGWITSFEKNKLPGGIKKSAFTKEEQIILNESEKILDIDSKIEILSSFIGKRFCHVVFDVLTKNRFLIYYGVLKYSIKSKIHSINYQEHKDTNIITEL